MKKISSSQSRQKALADETFKIFQDPRAEEILLNGWLTDPGLLVPSVDFIVFLSWQIFESPNFISKVYGLSYEDGVKLLVDEVRPQKKTKISKTIARIWGEMESQRLHTIEKKGGERVYEWHWILRKFHFLDRDSPVEVQISMRAICSRLLEALSLRAIFKQDVDAIRASAVSLEKIKLGQPFYPQPFTNIASEILYWQVFVRDELGNDINKATMVSFVSELHPSLANSTPETWAKAWKTVGWPEAFDRKGKRRSEEAKRLAKSLKANDL